MAKARTYRLWTYRSTFIRESRADAINYAMKYPESAMFFSRPSVMEHIKHYTGLIPFSFAAEIRVVEPAKRKRRAKR